MATTKPITFRCPNAVLEAIDRIGRDRYSRPEGGYDRTAAILDIINAGITAIEGGLIPQLGERGLPDQHSLDDIRQLIRQELEGLFPSLLEQHVEAVLGK
ncbi:MAG: hypothetical protein ACM37W_00345 [Actinomycetota bacterium]